MKGLSIPFSLSAISNHCLPKGFKSHNSGAFGETKSISGKCFEIMGARPIRSSPLLPHP